MVPAWLDRCVSSLCASHSLSFCMGHNERERERESFSTRTPGGKKKKKKFPQKTGSSWKPGKKINYLVQPDITVMVGWALKMGFLSTHLFSLVFLLASAQAVPLPCLFAFTAGDCSWFAHVCTVMWMCEGPCLFSLLIKVIEQRC